ncbi:hypothetical protein HN911_00815 [Candidatus Bathyarchaeota archaeon]|nr:hypothetical protein [Candidatus Bathyarchaeota archaeon]MBT7914476.1 hypothetical protein [Candidatus Bathyarchaeota archaeon]
MLAAEFNLVAEQGSTFALTFVWKDKDGTVVDLTTLDMLINIGPSFGTTRVKYGNWHAATKAQTGEITIGPTDIATPDGTDGKIVIGVTAAEMATWEYRDHVYMVELTTGDGVTKYRVAQGSFNVYKEIPNT